MLAGPSVVSEEMASGLLCWFRSFVGVCVLGSLRQFLALFLDGVHLHPW